MKKILGYTLSIALIYCTSCKEPYFPKIEDAQKLLVVEGLLTDESNLITVKLSKTVPFQELIDNPEIGATLIVSDNKGNEFSFIERPPGIYKSKAFEFEYGSTYILNITTKNKKKYKSSPQKLFPKSELGPITSAATSKTLQTFSGNSVVVNTLPGLEFSTITSTETSSPYFRFSNMILLEYTEKINYLSNPDSIPGYFYCWKKYMPNESFNINDAGYSNLAEYKHKLAFCPIDKSYFGILMKEVGVPSIIYVINRNFYYFVLTVKRYNINEDIHQYYKAINDQIEAKNRIFDPISFQVRGNITCIDDPNEPVLGVFEVASTSSRTYSFSDFFIDKSYKFEEIDYLDIEALPQTGSLYDSYPDFWIFNY